MREEVIRDENNIDLLDRKGAVDPAVFARSPDFRTVSLQSPIAGQGASVPGTRSGCHPVHPTCSRNSYWPNRLEAGSRQHSANPG